MAEPTIRTTFIAGPCDADVKQVPVSILKTGAVTCQGETYGVHAVAANHYDAIWVKSELYTGPPITLGGTPQFNMAWTALMHTLAFKVPTMLTRQQVALQRIRRAVR